MSCYGCVHHVACQYDFIPTPKLILLNKFEYFEKNVRFECQKAIHYYR